MSPRRALAFTIGYGELSLPAVCDWIQVPLIQQDHLTCARVVIRVFCVIMVAAYSGFSLDALLGSTFLTCISAPFGMH